MVLSITEEFCSLRQYICWWLGREPNQKDFSVLINFLSNNNAVLVRASRNALDYRKFDVSKGVIHIIIRRKYFGIAINIHRDLEVHSNVYYDQETLVLISRIYNHLKRNKYAKLFLLPREEREFEKFLKYGKKWNMQE